MTLHNITPKPDMSLSQVIPRAEAVSVSRIDGHAPYACQPVGMIYPSMGGTMREFRNVTRYHKTLRGKPDFQIWIVKYAGVWTSDPPIYDYVTGTGELGRGDDWCYVSERFKKWFHVQFATQPQQHYVVGRTPHGATTLVDVDEIRNPKRERNVQGVAPLPLPTEGAD